MVGPYHRTGRIIIIKKNAAAAETDLPQLLLVFFNSILLCFKHESSGVQRSEDKFRNPCFVGRAVFSAPKNIF